MTYDISIVGGGIVGLATAYQVSLANPKLKVLLLEKEASLAQHQTGNNSGVIHSGLYYKPGSLKATNCRHGYQQLLDFCDRENVPYDLCGKIVVATSQAEIPLLENLYQRGLANGLTGLQKLEQDELKEYEPHVNGLQGIFVPQTGIINFIKVAEKYGEKARAQGVEIQLSQKVIKLVDQKNMMVIETETGQYPTKLVINCGGLYSDKLARMTQHDPEVKIVPFRGEYYELVPEKEYLVKNLIYPVPDPNFPFLGVHFTRMIEGGVEAGPNAVLAFSREGYKKTDIRLGELAETLLWPGFRKIALKYWKTGMGEMYRSFSKKAFTRALQKLIPEIQASDLVAGGAGVRAQASHRNGSLLDDFMILEKANSINVCNAPSPGATSSLSVGKSIADLAMKRF
ncbi:MAG: L-2-hydroxyglutarate oxidase [Cyclobacteriaceae bacterium]